MDRTEIARRGGNALAAKVSNAYFEMIGRRGGRVHVYRANMASAIEWREKGDEEMFEHYLKKAERWHDELGCRVMLELWLKENCPPKTRKPWNTDDAKFRRWQRSFKATHIPAKVMDSLGDYRRSV